MNHSKKKKNKNTHTQKTYWLDFKLILSCSSNLDAIIPSLLKHLRSTAMSVYYLIALPPADTWVMVEKAFLLLFRMHMQDFPTHLRNPSGYFAHSHCSTGYTTRDQCRVMSLKFAGRLCASQTRKRFHARLVYKCIRIWSLSFCALKFQVALTTGTDQSRQCLVCFQAAKKMSPMFLTLQLNRALTCEGWNRQRCNGIFLHICQHATNSLKVFDNSTDV